MLLEWNKELANKEASDARKAEAYCVRYTILLLLVKNKIASGVSTLICEDLAISTTLEPPYSVMVSNTVNPLVVEILNSADNLIEVKTSLIVFLALNISKLTWLHNLIMKSPECAR